MKTIILFISITLLTACARPCPKDIKVGDLAFTNETQEFLSVFRNVSTLEFVNEKKEILSLIERPGHRSDEGAIPIEVLCEAGDFLDKTTQIRFFKTAHFSRSFASTNDDFEVNVTASIDNDNELGGLDTILYESFTLWGQIISLSGTGRFSLLSSDRGSNEKLKDFVKLQHSNYLFVADTIIQGTRFLNIFMRKHNNDNSTINIIYSKSKGIECIITPSDMWLRKI